MIVFFFARGGLEAVNPGQVHSPLAALLVSFLSASLVFCVVFGIRMTLHNFVMKLIIRGNLCQCIVSNPNPKQSLGPQFMPHWLHLKTPLVLIITFSHGQNETECQEIYWWSVMQPVCQAWASRL